MITSARNSKNVVSVTTFDVERNILEDERSIFQFENTNNEITIIVYQSLAARRRMQKELAESREYKEFKETFNCIVCETMTKQRRLEYFPPFD